MAAKDDLWAAVQGSYSEATLVSLTRIDDPDESTIDATFGLNACADVIALWPAYAQVDFDSTSGLHLAAAKQAVIALFWKRGGVASEAQRIEWEDVWGPDGPIVKIQRTGPRARISPSSNSDLQTTGDTAGQFGWADPASLPDGTLPTNANAEDED